MDPNTLTLYGVAGVLSVALCLVLLTFAYFLPGTRLIRYWVAAIAVMSTALLIAGVGPALPRWATVVLANVLMLSTGPILYSGFSALGSGRPAGPDKPGWILVAATIPGFWYWGLVEPTGNYRSVLFSLVVAVTSGRTAWLVLRRAAGGQAGVALWFIGLFFTVLTLWMLGRAGSLLLADLPPSDVRSANPTTWVTVFWYILVVSCMSICAMWMEVPKPTPLSGEKTGRLRVSAFVNSFPNKLLLLATATIVNIIVIACTLGVVYSSFYSSEKDYMERLVRLSNEAMAEHTEQLVNLVDASLLSVRAYLKETGSLAKTAQFIKDMRFDSTIIHNIYVIDAAGQIVVAPGEDAGGRSVSHRDYFLFHRDTLEDSIFIAPVNRGVVTGRFHFRVTRRAVDANGAFAGVVLAAIDQERMAEQFRERWFAEHSQMTLLGTNDRRVRASVPPQGPESWEAPVDSQLWGLLDTSAVGWFRSGGRDQGILKTNLYKRVPGLPLVVVASFSDDDLLAMVYSRMLNVVLVLFVILTFSLLFTFLLTIEARRRDEQDRFMSMLSHELKTPLSVIRLTLGALDLPKKMSARLERAVSDIRNVVERCLQTDRLQHSRISVSYESCRMADVLRRLAEASGAPERLAITCDDLPACRTDAQLLDTVLQNLIDNALKYGSEQAAVQIRAAPASRHRTPGVAVTVSNLRGVAGAPDPAKVFHRYYREPTAHNRTGSGLGLHISAGFAEILGGTLRYLPGTEEVQFQLWLPTQPPRLWEKMWWALQM